MHMNSNNGSGTGTTKSQKLMNSSLILGSTELSSGNDKDNGDNGDNKRKGSSKEKSSIFNLAFGPKRLAPELSFLRLGGMQLEQRKHAVWKSTDILCNLLPLLDKGKLTHVDISLDRMTAMDAAHPASGGQLPLDEKCVMKMFKLLASQVPRLQTLVMQHWRLKVSEKTAREFAKFLGSLASLSDINLDNSAVVNENGRRIDHLIVQSFLGHCKGVSDISWAAFDPGQLNQLAKVVNDNIQGNRLTLKLDGIPLSAIKDLVAFSRSYANCQMEYLGNHAVAVHRTKDKGEHLMQRLRRFL